MSRKLAPVWEWIRKVRDPDAGPASSLVRALCFYFATRMNPDGSNCWPGVRLIAAEMRLDKSTVLRAIHEAEAAGWVRIVKRHSGRRGGEHNAYLPAIPNSGCTVPPLPDPEVVGPYDHYGASANGGSGRTVHRSGRIGLSKVVAPCDLSSSGSSQEPTHGNVPVVADATQEQPSELTPVEQSRKELLAEARCLVRDVWPDMPPWQRVPIVEHYVDGAMLTVPDDLPQPAEPLEMKP